MLLPSIEAVAAAEREAANRMAGQKRSHQLQVKNLSKNNKTCERIVLVSKFVQLFTSFVAVSYKVFPTCWWVLWGFPGTLDGF